MTWIVLTLVVLSMGAMVSALTARRYPGGLRLGISAAGIAGASCMIAGWTVLGDTSVARFSVEWPMSLGFARLAIDGLSAWFLLVIGVVSLGVSIYSWSYFGAAKEPGPVGAYAPLVCTMLGAMVLVVCAADAVLFLVGWEVMSLSAFFLVGFRDEDAEARRGAWTYLVATHLGTGLCVLPVFAVFTARTGGTAMDGFTGAFDASEITACVVIFMLGVAGFGTKAGFMPFHVWLPAAHPVAPGPVSALMSGVVIKTGIYGLLRMLSWLPDLPVGCAVGLMLVSLTTGFMGILYALGQRQVKRMLAYSSVENMGIIGVAISVAVLGRTLHQPELVAFGLGGALLHVLNHALIKSLLFLSAGAVVHETGTGDMERLGGLAHHAPINMTAFLTGSVAICALPPLNGFVSEFAIYSGILQGIVNLSSSYSAILAFSAAVLALIGGLTLVVFSKAFSIVFLGAPRDRSIRVHPAPATMNAGMLFLAMGCVVVGFGSVGLLPAVSAALTPFAPATDLAETLGASLSPVVRSLPPLAVLSVLGTGLIAFRQRMPLGATAGGTGSTWGCGFAIPGPRMQYTASSFSWTLIHSFRQVSRPNRTVQTPVNCFPSPVALSTATTDLAHEKIYTPVFTGLARLFERLWPLQHGRIQLYLLYIVATVLIVFLIEGWSAPFPASKNDDVTIGARHSGTRVQVHEIPFQPVVVGGSNHGE